jgi:hypothetical protein
VLYSVTELRARPEKVGEAEEIGRRSADRGSALAPDLAWSLYEVASGGFGTYHVVAAAESWEAIGAVSSIASMIAVLFGEQGVDPMVERVLDCFASVSQTVMRDRPELGLPALGSERGPVLELTRLHTRPDGQAEIEAYFERLAEAVRKTGDPRRFWVNETLVGELGLYAMESPVARLGELDSILPPGELLARAFGVDEGTAIQERARQATRWAERHILVRRDELSVLR